MIIFYFVSVLLAFIYIFIITHILTAWQEIEEWTVSPAFKPDTSITVVIPFRNEEDVLGQCLTSILRCNYPKDQLEIIAVNDHSEDNFMDVIPNGVKLIHSKSPGKKQAITKGVSEANGKLIITTDADCIVHKDWIKTIASYYEYTKKRLIVGMVELEGHENILESFQIMETCGTMGLHAAGIHNKTHYLANGANLIFEKSVFETLNPYADNANIASGDDVFFVNHVGQSAPDQIGFLKALPTIVVTKAERTWMNLWHQRKRWATKTSKFSRGIYTWFTAAIWLLSASILLNIILIPFFGSITLFILLMQLLIKGIMDYLYLYNLCSYFNKEKVLKYFIPSSLIQTLYIFIAGIFAMSAGKYKWKGRTVT